MTFRSGFTLPTSAAQVPLRSLALGGAALLGLSLLTGCGSSSTATTSSGVASSGAAASATSAPAATGLTLRDGWVKAAPNGMTSIFGTLDNPTGADINVVSATSPVASMVEMHEVTMVDGAMKMHPKIGGFVVPAHGIHVLEPGHDHIMVMGLTKPIKAGDPVTATLKLKDGTSVSITAIGKDFSAGNESYQPSSAAGMSMAASPSMSGGMTP
jgi:copper(I)-binding protein